VGLDLRVIKEDCVSEIVEALCAAGVDARIEKHRVDVNPEACAKLGIVRPTEPVIETAVHCRRDGEQIVLSVCRQDEPSEGFQIYIPNVWSWRPSRRRRLRQLQQDVTTILEHCGATWPFDD
jgi:hypothetical protein